MLIVPLLGSWEGVVARRSVDGATERADDLGNQSSVVRRLRAGLVTPHSGGLGSLSVPTTGDCLEWLDAVRMKAGESLPDRGPRRDPSAPGSTAPGTEIAAKWSAGRRLSVSQTEEDTPPQGVSGGFAGRSGGFANLRVSRRFAPSHLEGFKERQAFPAPRQKTRTMSHA